MLVFILPPYYAFKYSRVVKLTEGMNLTHSYPSISPVTMNLVFVSQLVPSCRIYHEMTYDDWTTIYFFSRYE